MEIKELIEKVEDYKSWYIKAIKEDNNKGKLYNEGILKGIKQTIETIDEELAMKYSKCYEDWKKLKKLLETK